MSTARFFSRVFTVWLAALIVIPSASAQLVVVTDGEDVDVPKDDEFGDQDCNCYYDADCPELSFCDVGTPMCLNSGKLDGLCFIWQCPPGFGGKIDRIINGYFSSYSVALQSPDGGGPDPRIAQRVLDEAFALEPVSGESSSGQTCPIQVVERNSIINTLNNSMERVLGFDFHIVANQRFGTIRSVDDPEAATAIVEATRRGLARAIRTGNPGAVRASLSKFWEQYPDFRPMHTGRCYPHGHDDEQTPLACQVDALTRIASGLISCSVADGKL